MLSLKNKRYRNLAIILMTMYEYFDRRTPRTVTLINVSLIYIGRILLLN
jgi:hypothetical protein